MIISKAIAEQLFFKHRGGEDCEFVQSGNFKPDGGREQAYCAFKYRDKYYKFLITRSPPNYTNNVYHSLGNYLYYKHSEDEEIICDEVEPIIRIVCDWRYVNVN